MLADTDVTYKFCINTGETDELMGSRLGYVNGNPFDYGGDLKKKNSCEEAGYTYVAVTCENWHDVLAPAVDATSASRMAEVCCLQSAFI